MKSKKIISVLAISAILASGVAMAGASSSRQDTKNILLFTNNNTYDYCVVNNHRNLVLTNKNGEIISYVSIGQMVEVLDSGKNQSLVKIRETGDTGYISNQDIRFIKSGVNSQITNQNLAGETINISSSVNLRENPSLNSTVLRALPNDTQLKILAKQGEWFKVDVDNSIGFIYEEYVGVNKISNNNYNLKNSTSNNGVVKTTNNESNIGLVHNSVINTSVKNALKNNSVESIPTTQRKVNTINSENTTSKIKEIPADKVNNTKADKAVKADNAINRDKVANRVNGDNSNNKDKVVKVDNVINKDKAANKVNEDNSNNKNKVDSVVNRDANKKVSTPIKKDINVKPAKQNDKVKFDVNKQEFNVSEPSTYSLAASVGEPVLIASPNPSYKEFSYSQLGANATINGKNANISFSGAVNNQVPGNYPVEMSVKLSNGKVVSKKIDVKIKDLPPVIVLNNNIVEPGNYTPYSNFIVGAYSVEGQNLSNDIECYGSPIGVLNQSSRFYSGPTTLDLSVKDKYGTIGTVVDPLTVSQSSLPTITGKNVVLKQGQKFKYSDLDINVQNGSVYSVEYTTDLEGADFIQSIPDKKGTYYVWVTATNNDMYTCSEEMYKVTIL